MEFGHVLNAVKRLFHAIRAPRLHPIDRMWRTDVPYELREFHYAATEGLPVFIGHRLGGSLMEFALLVGHIRSPHPMYGMQATGTDGVAELFDCIAEYVTCHLS